MKRDERLQGKVQDALHYEPLLHAAEIGVIVSNGVVTLTGTVDHYSKKMEAENAAEQVRGVKAVVERIEIVSERHAQKTDEEIAQALLHAFEWNWNIPDNKIVVKVEKAWVWLEGTLEWEYQREAAVRVATSMAGVKGITNNLLLKTETKDKLEKEIVENALRHHWAVNPAHIHVKAEHGKVTLTGTVDSLYERAQAARIAWKAKGVTNVENELEVAFDDDYI